MKLTYIFPFLTGPYGAERLLSDIIRGISRNKERFPEISLLTIGDAPSADELFEDIKGLQRRSIMSKPLSIKVMTLVSPFLLVLAVWRHLERDVDIVHIMNWQSMLVAPFIKRLAPQAKIIYTCTEPPRFMYDLRGETLGDAHPILRPFLRVYMAIIRSWDKRAVHSVDSFISIGDWTQEAVQKIYNLHTEIIYPGIQLSRFENSDSVSSRERLGIDTQQKVYITVSKIHVRKKLTDSVDLFIEHSAGDPDARYYIIGGGPFTEKLAKYLDEVDDNRIKMMGRLSEQDVTDFFIASDFFIFTAKNEPFGISPLEAKAAGAELLGIDRGYEIFDSKDLGDKYLVYYDKL